jgi:SNF2 family DNA or RNA helicase
MPLLIQYRKDPVKCLISWYKLEVAYDRIPEQIDEWHKFAEQRVKYLIKWFNKWVCKEYKNSLYVEYDNFLSEPLKSMQLIIEHLSPGQNVDLRHLNKVVDEANISYKSNIQNFIFFDQQYVDQLRKNISESIDFHTIIPHSSRY